MKILLTGANGYIGSKVCKYLCDHYYEVIAVDLCSTHIDSRARFINFDIFNLEDKDLFSFFDEPDVCLHLAWRDGFKHNSNKHILDLSSHFKFLENLVKNGLKNLAIMGTMHEVGYREGAVDENTPCKPTNYYGISKNCLRECTKLLCEEYNCSWKWLRAFYIYGNDDYGASVFCKIRKAFEDGTKEFSLTSGTNKFDFIDIDELSELISLSIVQNQINGIINVSSGKPISLKDQILMYVKINNIKLKLNWGFYPERESESPCIYGDNTKISEIIKNSTLL